MTQSAVQRRTRIVATLGPASDSPEMIRRLIDAGVNVFRLNFSHGSHQTHGGLIANIRTAASEKSKPIAILQDLQGPKIRTGELADHRPVELAAGAAIRITTDSIAGSAERICTPYDHLPNDVSPGDTILLDDGHIELRASRVSGNEITADVVTGGVLGEHKGIHVPGCPISAPALTQKDIADLSFGVKAGVDFVSLSFVRRPEDVEQVRRETIAFGRELPVIAKIECLEALKNIDGIVRAADGLMVARGDLGVETSAADIPLLQKQILAIAGKHGKPDITATEMLESMISCPRPTRAEATDVANAVFDGTDAIMLSGETAVGAYALEAVQTMSEIATNAERHLDEYGRKSILTDDGQPTSIAEAAAHAACLAAREIGASALAVFTLSGHTARLVVARRMDIPVLAFTPSAETYRRLALAWGVTPIHSEFVENPDELAEMENQRVRESGLVNDGDLVIMLAGSTTMPGVSNNMRIHRVGAAGK